MIKFLNSLKKTAFLSLVMCAFLVLNSHAAQASCAVSVGSETAKATPNLTKSITTSTADITKDGTEITKAVTTFGNKVVTAVSGLTTAISEGAKFVAISNAKVHDSLLSQQNTATKRMELAKIARDKRINGSNCVQQTGKDHVAEVDLLAEAVEKTLAADFNKGVLGGLSASGAANSIEYKADVFRFMMANFCNPESNGGLMPTRDNPIETSSGPLWCGMDRGAGEEYLKDFHLTFLNLLFSPNVLVDSEEARTGVSIIANFLFGEPADKVSLPSLSTAAGQGAFNASFAKGVRRSLAAAPYHSLVADIWPTADKDASAYIKEMYKYKLGENPPEAVANFIEEKYGDKPLSRSQLLAAIVDYTTSAQNGFDTTGNSQGQYNQEMLNAINLSNYLAMELLEEQKKSVLLSAATFAVDG